MTAGAVLALIMAVRSDLHHHHRWRPDPYIALAIAKHESGFEPGACNDEKDGSSSWGLMQINHKDSRCADGLFARELDPGVNVALGVRLLSSQHDWHLKHCTHPHDVLVHYAGTGPDAYRFARDIRRMARTLKKGMA